MTKKSKFKLPLINAHTHAAMIRFRGQAEDLSLSDWRNRRINPLQKKEVSPEFVYKYTKQAIREMQANGIKAFADMYFFQEEAARAAVEANMPVLLGVDISDFVGAGKDLDREGFEAFLSRYKENDLINISLSVPSLNTMTHDYLVYISELTARFHIPAQIHISETEEEERASREKNGLSQVKYADRLGLLNERSLLIHCVRVSERDIDVIRERRCHVVHCPLSNLKLGSGVAPITKMMDAGINICLGTDSAASSNRLDIWEAGKFAVLLQRGITGNPAGIRAEDAFRMMTVNGMRALGLEKIGNRTLKDIERIMTEYEDYHVLYSQNINELLDNSQAL